jgi:hypothetical protein
MLMDTRQPFYIKFGAIPQSLMFYEKIKKHQRVGDNMIGQYHLNGHISYSELNLIVQLMFLFDTGRLLFYL